MTILHQVLVHLRAGRWNEAHNLVQSDDSPLGAWLHGILHIQEGDLEDAEYWYGKADRHFRSRGSLDEELALFRSRAAAWWCFTVASLASVLPRGLIHRNVQRGVCVFASACSHSRVPGRHWRG